MWIHEFTRSCTCCVMFTVSNCTVSKCKFEKARFFLHSEQLILSCHQALYEKNPLMIAQGEDAYMHAAVH